MPSCWTVKLRPDPSSNKQCMPLIIQLKWPSQVNKHQLSLFTKAAEPKPAKIFRVPPQEEYVRRLSWQQMSLHLILMNIKWTDTYTYINIGERHTLYLWAPISMRLEREVRLNLNWFKFLTHFLRGVCQSASSRYRLTLFQVRLV